MLEMVTSTFNLTCWRLCPPLTDGSDHDLIAIPLNHRASLVAQMIKNLPVMQETWVRSLG